MAETIDIRELNERIERQSAFVTNLTTGMDQVIVGTKASGRVVVNWFVVRWTCVVGRCARFGKDFSYQDACFVD